MQGRQVHFFVTREDHLLLERFIGVEVGFVAMRAESHRSAPELIDSTVVEKMGGESLEVFLTRSGDVGKIVFNERGGIYKIDVELSPAIQFIRGFEDGRVLRSASMYYIPRYCDASGSAVKKDQGFIDWAEKVFSTVKRFFGKRQYQSTYCGEGAERARLAGIRFE